jgi:hypothetical protein
MPILLNTWRFREEIRERVAFGFLRNLEVAENSPFAPSVWPDGEKANSQKMDSWVRPVSR